MQSPIRLLPYTTADGPWNMAADEVLLEAAENGAASVRVYSWDPPTVSLGYFQRHEERLRAPRLAAYPWVRRATGGGAIIHDGDLTYAIALPRRLQAGLTPNDWHCRIHRVLAEILAAHSIPAEVVSGERAPQSALGYDCFAVPQPGDVVLAGPLTPALSPVGRGSSQSSKIIGGAQRLRKGALLQHGSMQVPDLRKLIPDLPERLAAGLGFQVEPADWQPTELNRIQQLAEEHYATEAWNCKR